MSEGLSDETRIYRLEAELSAVQEILLKLLVKLDLDMEVDDSAGTVELVDKY